jgi:hypothetical protein
MIIRLFYFIITFSLGQCYAALSQLSPAVYIEQFKDIAQEEMRRTGIPASIKLAQGLLESNWGRSPLASEANNHFGIKCGNQWLGGMYFKEDDDYDQQGNLLSSCFRVFENAEASYVAHSEFLMDPAKKFRYGSLFELATTDYHSWAHGLKNAGYATDPEYPSKLIGIIENHKLYQYDEAIHTLEGDFFASVESDKIEDEDIVMSESGSRLKPVKRATEMLKTRNTQRKDYRVFEINGVKAVKAVGGESLISLAQALGESLDELVFNNEMSLYHYTILNQGEIIFLERKKRDYHGREHFHKATEGETMLEISQKYGIRLSNLMHKNRLPEGVIPIPGEKISLKERVSPQDKPRYYREKNENKADNKLFSELYTAR